MESSNSNPRNISIPASDTTRSESITYQSDNVVKFDPENRVATEVLDKDLKRWKRKLEELGKLKVPWSAILFGLGTTGLSIIAVFINKNTKLISIPAFIAIACFVFIIIAMILWRWYESNIPSIAKDILLDLPKLNDGEPDESR